MSNDRKTLPARCSFTSRRLLPLKAPGHLAEQNSSSMAAAENGKDQTPFARAFGHLFPEARPERGCRIKHTREQSCSDISEEQAATGRDPSSRTPLGTILS